MSVETGPRSEFKIQEQLTEARRAWCKGGGARHRRPSLAAPPARCAEDGSGKRASLTLFLFVFARSPLFTDTAVYGFSEASRRAKRCDATRDMYHIATIYVWPGSTPRQNEHHGACACAPC